MTAKQINRAIARLASACEARAYMTPRDCQCMRDLYAALRVARVAA